MGSTQWLSVPVSQLELGLPLRYTIYSESRVQLANAGELFSQPLKATWEQLGIATVCIELGESPPSDEEIQPHDLRLIRQLEENLSLASELVFEMAARMHDKQVFTCAEFEELTIQMLEGIREDSAAALLAMFNSGQTEHSEWDRTLADRCAQLALLSLLIGQESGLDEPDCFIASMAALLHDISLMGFNFEAEEDDQYDAYRQHPLRSASLVDSMPGISPKVVMAIAQVHENPSGDGFPRNLSPHRILPIAKVINFADTYLTLTLKTQPPMMPVARHFHPADALGYMMFHASTGRFEVASVRGLIRVASLYPIGSEVCLSDQTRAVVFRSSGIAPSKPIVKLKTSQKLLDLRYSSLAITGPCRDGSQYQVLPKSQLKQVYWG